MSRNRKVLTFALLFLLMSIPSEKIDEGIMKIIYVVAVIGGKEI